MSSILPLPVLLAFSLISTMANAAAVTKAPNAEPAKPRNGAAANGYRSDPRFRTASAVEIVRLKKAGVDASVIKAYVETARVPYLATSEDILYLHENQIPDDIVVAWMKKGSELVDASTRAAARNASVMPQNVQPPPALSQPKVIYQAPPQEPSPTVVYTSPSYVYSDYYPYYYGYRWPVYYSYSWGWPYWSGHGHAHHYRHHYGHHHSRHYAHYGHHRGHYRGHGYHRGWNGHHGGYRHHGGWNHAGYRNHGGYRHGGHGGHSFAGGRHFGGGARPHAVSGGFRGGGGARFAGGGGGFRGGGRR